MSARMETSDVPAVQGRVEPGFEGVLEAFERNFDLQGDRGGAFSAIVDGRSVVDVWGGWADREAERPWREDTLVGIFSGSKGLVATCLLILVERGALDLDEPVCAYWPEFAANGKEDVRVRQLVSHTAGLPGLETPVTAEAATDGARMAALLADQPTLYSPGFGFHYHALTFGWLCGELVRRIDGRTVGTFFDEEVARPLRLDAWIGLPVQYEDRVAVLERGPGFGSQKRDLLAAVDEDPVAWSVWANPPRFATDRLPANTRSWHAAEIPATSAIASARSIARLYGCLARGGEIDGVRVLRPRTLELGATLLGRGVDPYLEEEMAFGVGFQLQTDAMRLGPEKRAFGHNGAGGSAHGAWPRLRTGFSYSMNVLRESDGPDPRATALMAALHAALTSRSEAPR